MAQRPKRGASRARSGRINVAGVRVWLAHHAATFIASLGRLREQPFASVMTVLVIGIALALPAGLQLIVKNARDVSGRWDNAVELSAYLSPEIDKSDAQALAKQVEARADIGAVELVAAADALAMFKTRSGFGEALDALDTNPLPATLIVRPADASKSPDEVQRIADEIGALEHVDLVQLDTEWVKRFHAILDVARRAVLVASLMLAAAVLLIIGNTIRMDIHSRRDEIEVSKLIGAGDGFIRRPFLYSGVWYGLAGGIAAWILVGLVLAMMAEPVASVSGEYGSGFRLAGLGIGQSLALVGGGALLGWLGSWIAATRHLRRIEPS